MVLAVAYLFTYAVKLYGSGKLLSNTRKNQLFQQSNPAGRHPRILVGRAGSCGVDQQLRPEP